MITDCQSDNRSGRRLGPGFGVGAERRGELQQTVVRLTPAAVVQGALQKPIRSGAARPWAAATRAQGAKPSSQLANP